MNYGKHYSEMIGLEALDRRLKEDIRSFVNKGDNDGVELAQFARRECQNRMLQITLEVEEDAGLVTYAQQFYYEEG